MAEQDVLEAIAKLSTAVEQVYLNLRREIQEARAENLTEHKRTLATLSAAREDLTREIRTVHVHLGAEISELRRTVFDDNARLDSRLRALEMRGTEKAKE